MSNERSNQLLGELLTEAGLLKINDLREAANIARSQKLPIGKVLVMAGYISKELLEASIEVQARVKDNLLDYELGLKALGIVSSTNCSLEQALSKCGAPAQRNADSTTNRLGALLLDSSLLSKSEFDTALEESKRCGLPLGRVLTNLSLLPEKLINYALNAQKMLRNGQISKEQAIKSLVETNKSSDSNPVLTAVGQGSSQQVKPSGTQPIPESGQSNTKSTFEFYQQNTQSPAQNTKSAIPELESLSLHHVLRIAGLIETNALEEAIKESLESPDVMGLILKRSGLLEEFVIEAAKECCQLISSGKLKPEQAIIALHQCQRTRNSIQDCLEEYGWLEKSEPEKAEIVW